MPTWSTPTINELPHAATWNKPASGIGVGTFDQEAPAFLLDQMCATPVTYKSLPANCTVCRNGSSSGGVNNVDQVAPLSLDISNFCWVNAINVAPLETTSVVNWSA